jgi:signal transduction histidine kinase
MRLGSLRIRLAIIAAISIVVVLTISAFGLSMLFERHVVRRMNAELDTYVRQLAAGILLTEGGTLRLIRPLADPRFSEPDSGLYWQIEDDNNGAQLRSRSLWENVIGLPQDNIAPGAVHRHQLEGPHGARLMVTERLLIYPHGTDTHQLRIAAAADEKDVRAAVWQFASDVAAALAFLAGILMLVSWLQISVGLRPLVTLREKVAAIRSGQEKRIGIDGPMEVMPLVQEFNSLLEDRENAVTSAKARAADLAHGLKTSLTVLAGDTERLRHKGEIAIADEIDELAADMRRHVQHELSRAMIQATGRPAAPHPVLPAIERVVRTLSRSPKGAPLSWRIDADENTVIPVRDDDLFELLGAVLENAMKWAACEVAISAEGSSLLRITVEDDGPGVANEHLPLLGQRGVRLDEAVEGTGLGLSLAGEIAGKYGGRLRFERAALGGLRVTAELPAT